MKKSMNSQKNDNRPLFVYEKIIIAVFTLCSVVALLIWLSLL